MNPWIKKVQETEARRGQPVAMERARNIYISLTLGRGFNQSVDDYFASKPELAEFVAWFERYAKCDVCDNSTTLPSELCDSCKGGPQ